MRLHALCLHAAAYLRTIPTRAHLALRLVLAAIRLPLPDLRHIAAPLSSSALALPAPRAPSLSTILAVDIGGTRTKFLLLRGAVIHRLPPALTADLWQNSSLPGHDKFEPHSAPRRLAAYLRLHAVELREVGRLAFAVPGTVDLAGAGGRSAESAAEGGLSEGTSEAWGSDGDSKMFVVKNTPSMSPKFRGFDFKEAFRDVCPGAKISAVPDNLAAALGVACCQPELRAALVIVLGTAPSVATLFRDPSGKGKYIETAIWQSWVWFTKMKLDDPHGYVGGLKVSGDGVQVKPTTSAKIPHHQARIRFALDDITWQRLRGVCPSLPSHLQAHLSDEEATAVWCQRLQAAVNALAERFHSVYGPAQQIHVLGGNATRCHGVVSAAQYMTPDSVHDIRLTVPVVVYPTDEQQQMVHMAGLVYASCFKLKHVAAPGQDPLARGWTRGGEIYLWVAKGVKSEHELACAAVSALRAGGAAAPPCGAAAHLETCAACMREARGAKAARARLRAPPLPSRRWARLYLLRHAQTDWDGGGRIVGGRSDPPLNAAGEAQAAALGAFLAELPVRLVASSAACRATGTAAAVGAAHPAAARVVDARLGEMCLGSLEGKKMVKVKAAYRALLRAWKEGADEMAAPGEGGESPAQVAARGMAALRALALLPAAEGERREEEEEGEGEEEEGRHVCVVAHSRFNKVLIAALRGDLSRAAEISQGNACVNVIDFPLDGGPCVIARVNVCDHLADAPRGVA